LPWRSAAAALPQAQTVSFTDTRIKPEYVNYPSPGGNSGTMRGYLVAPSARGPFPAVLVVHENRGLNPYIEDVARRAAVEGFLAFAPTACGRWAAIRGTTTTAASCRRASTRRSCAPICLNGARFVKSHKLSKRQARVTGFCYGGGVVISSTTRWAAICMQAPLLRGGGRDGGGAQNQGALYPLRRERRAHQRDVAGIRVALKKSNVPMKHKYPGTQHGFHNNSTPRYSEPRPSFPG